MKKTKPIKRRETRSRFGQPLDGDGNCICPEALKPHAQHKPADPIEPGCQGSDCADGTCRTCAAVPEDQWIARKRVAHAPKVKRPQPSPATKTERRTLSEWGKLRALISDYNDALKLVEQLALYWVAEGSGCDEPGSAHEAFELLVKHGYTLSSTRAVFYRPDGSEVVR